MTSEHDGLSPRLAELRECRQLIEEIDNEILAALLKRIGIARQTGILKRAEGMPILDPQREAQVIRAAVSRARALGLDEEPSREIFWHILSMSRKAQQSAEE